MTQLRNAQYWDELAGNVPSEEQRLSDPYVELSFDLVREEWFELNDAMANNDVTEVLDACADLLKVVSQLCYALDVDAEDLLSEINKSNFSKFCTSKAKAIASVDAYRGDQRYHNVHFKQVNDNTYIILGYKIGQPADGSVKPKVLKGVDYKEPDLSRFIKGDSN